MAGGGRVQKSLVTAITTRRKQQQQMVQRAMLAEEDRRRAARKNFRMLTVPICSQASFEPSLLHATADDHEDGMKTLCDQLVSSFNYNRSGISDFCREWCYYLSNITDLINTESAIYLLVSV